VNSLYFSLEWACAIFDPILPSPSSRTPNYFGYISLGRALLARRKAPGMGLCEGKTRMVYLFPMTRPILVDTIPVPSCGSFLVPGPCCCWGRWKLELDFHAPPSPGRTFTNLESNFLMVPPSSVATRLESDEL
jgi:hypothetical protein